MAILPKINLADVLARLEALEAENTALKAAAKEPKSSAPKLYKSDKHELAFFVALGKGKPKFLYLEEAEHIAANIGEVRKLFAK